MSDYDDLRDACILAQAEDDMLVDRWLAGETVTPEQFKASRDARNAAWEALRPHDEKRRIRGTYPR